jgi:hypothetical protein
VIPIGYQDKKNKKKSKKKKKDPGYGLVEFSCMKKMQGPTRINHGSSVVKLTLMQLYFLSQIFDKAKVANHHPM